MIEITEFKALNKPALKAQVSIKMPKWGGFIIEQITVFEKDGARWISFPSKEYEKDGKKKYFQYNRFDTPEMSDTFRVHFFNAYDEYKIKNNII